MQSESPVLLLGAVAYSPKVVTIWEGFKGYFEERSLPFDFVLYSNYERQVDALFQRSIHVAWNSPLAWIRAERIGRATGAPVRAILMRDTDQDLRSVVLGRKSSGFRTLKELKGRKVAVGAVDSPQATLIPLELFRRAGMVPERDLEVVHFNLLPGKHGDHVGGEEEAAKALQAGTVDAACVLESNFLAFRKNGLLDSEIEVIAATPPFDHCNFTVGAHAPQVLVSRFRELLLEMSYDDPAVRPLLNLEGLQCWKEGRASGYSDLHDAVDASAFYDAAGNICAAGYRY